MSEKIKIPAQYSVVKSKRKQDEITEETEQYTEMEGEETFLNPPPKKIKSPTREKEEDTTNVNLTEAQTFIPEEETGKFDVEIAMAESLEEPQNINILQQSKQQFLDAVQKASQLRPNQEKELQSVLQEIQKLIKNESRLINIKGKGGETALHTAVLYNSQPVTNFLLKLGADATIQNDKGLFPYQLGPKNSEVTKSAETTNTDQLKSKTTAQQTITTTQRTSDFGYQQAEEFEMEALEEQELEMVMIASSKDPDQKLFQKNKLEFFDLVTKAVQTKPGSDLEGFIDKIALLLKKDQSVLNSKGQYGETALHWAVETGHTRLAAFLLEQNADPTLKDGTNKLPHQRGSSKSEAAGLVEQAYNTRIKGIATSQAKPQSYINIISPSPTPQKSKSSEHVPSYQSIHTQLNKMDAWKKKQFKKPSTATEPDYTARIKQQYQEFTQQVLNHLPKYERHGLNAKERKLSGHEFRGGEVKVEGLGFMKDPFLVFSYDKFTIDLANEFFVKLRAEIEEYNKLYPNTKIIFPTKKVEMETKESSEKKEGMETKESEEKKKESMETKEAKQEKKELDPISEMNVGFATYLCKSGDTQEKIVVIAPSGFGGEQTRLWQMMHKVASEMDAQYQGKAKIIMQTSYNLIRGTKAGESGREKAKQQGRIIEEEKYEPIFDKTELYTEYNSYHDEMLQHILNQIGSKHSDYKTPKIEAKACSEKKVAQMSIKLKAIYDSVEPVGIENAILGSSINREFPETSSKQYKWRCPCEECMKAIPAYHAINSLNFQNLSPGMNQTFKDEKLMVLALENEINDLKTKIQAEEKIQETVGYRILLKKLKMLEENIAYDEKKPHVAAKTEEKLTPERKQFLKDKVNKELSEKYIGPEGIITKSKQKLEELKSQLNEKTKQFDQAERALGIKATHLLSPPRDPMEWKGGAQSREPELRKLKESQQAFLAAPKGTPAPSGGRRTAQQPQQQSKDDTKKPPSSSFTKGGLK